MLKTLQMHLQTIVRDLYDRELEIHVSIPEEKFGDVASNVAMQLAKQLGENPREIAEKIAEKIREIDTFKSCEIAGPGFLNITYDDSALIGFVNKKSEENLKGKKILVEYSDPNPFKPLHAGHLYTTLVGDVIARLVEHAGADTIRINYGGDVGLHTAKSMWAIIQKLDGENPDKLNSIAEDDRPEWLGERYVEGNSAYHEDEHAKLEITKINKTVYEIHTKNDKTSDFAKIYWTCRQWSYDYFAVLYSRLQIHEFERYIPESEITPLGLKTVKKQTEAGVYEESDGAVIFDGEKYGLHKRVFINSEGLPTYETKDVGLSLTKWQDYKFDQSIIITASEQAQYMQVVIKSIEQFAPEPATRTRHLTHGVVKLIGGVKMSSREGNIVSALDILESAREAGRSSGAAKNEEIMLAAVKFAFLKSSIGGDIVYNPEESVAMEGKSGPYLQYAHARACSILRKAEGHKSADSALDGIKQLEGGERSLLRKMAEYNTVIANAVGDLAPHLICMYLYELAQEFNRFYEKNTVIGHDRQGVRIKLVYRYTATLSSGLGLLGIVAPEKM